MKEDGRWEITKTTVGDPIEELLTTRNYEMPLLWESIERQLVASKDEGRCADGEVTSIRARLQDYMNSSPYLRENK